MPDIPPHITRYGRPYTDHACGDLVPVVVTIARASAPATEPSKETAS